ncbi:MAG: GAF domain-containing protein, partial [Chloroflexota bacterium]
MMMTLPSALLPALIFTGTPEKIPAGSHHLVRPLAAVETPHALPARAGSVIMAAGSISQEVIATVRQRYPWQPLVLFTDEDGRAGWEARYDLLLLPFVLWEQLTSMDVLTTYIDLAETRRVQSISQNVSRIVHDIADPQAQLTYMAQALKHAVPFDAMNIFMRDDNSLRMLFHYGYENTPGNYSEDMRLPLKYASQMSVLNSGEVKLIADVNTHPDWETPSLESVDWIRSWLGIPVRRYGEVVGLIGMDAAHTNQFNDLHASRMQQLEDDISALVAAVDLEEMIDRSTHLVSAIRRQNLLMSIQFADRTSLEGVCRAIAETVVGVFGQMDCGVMLLSENRTELKRYARAGEYEVQATAPLYLNGRGLAVEAVRSGSAIYAPDVTADARYIPNEPRTRAELAIPLKLHDETIGVLDLQSARYHAFSNMDRDALAVFADHAATAIENVRLEMLTRDYTQQLEQRVADRTRELNLAVKRAETVLNRTSDVIVLLDSAGHIQQTNAAFNRLFGVQPDELFDVCLCKLATKAYHDDLLSKEIQKRSNGAVTSVDVQMKGKGGRVFDAEVTFAPIPASVGDGLEIVCSIRDITRHKEEKDLLHALLHRERQLNELKSRFIRTVTHEFRTPLTVIFSSMELLRDYYDRLKP